MKTVWEKNEGKGLQTIMNFSEGYKDFISNAKTEREATQEAIRLAKKKGFKDLNEVKKVKAGDKVYCVNRGKNLCLYVVGSKSLKEGMNILGAHIDSPRIDLKPNPLFEMDGLAIFDTHYYGGIKNYQWVTIPMALHGVVCKKDGTTVQVSIGEKESDPVVGISDLLVHLAQSQMVKKASEVVDGEDLDLIVGSIPAKSGKEKIKKNILDLLKKTYGITEEDFLSAELEAVPAGRARDFGLDRSMILGYGHDDRVCAYTSLMAILDNPGIPQRTSCCILVDKEEIGSVGSTGMHSRFFENTIASLLEKKEGYDEMTYRSCIMNSKMLSSDVSAGFDPHYPQEFERKNAAFLGGGLCFNKYTGSRGKGGCNDAHPEFIAQLRQMMDTDKVQFQFCELGRVNHGGGGTIAYILGNMDMDVIDAGVAVLNMHAPHEICSKADVYEAYRGYKTFLKKAK